MFCLLSCNKSMSLLCPKSLSYILGGWSVMAQEVPKWCSSLCENMFGLVLEQHKMFGLLEWHKTIWSQRGATGKNWVAADWCQSTSLKLEEYQLGSDWFQSYMVSEEARCFAHVFLGVQNIRYSQEVVGCLGNGNKITKHRLSKKTCFFTMAYP